MSNNERVSEDTTLSGWTLPAFDDSSWQNAVSAFRPVKMLPMQSPWKLTPRSIPMLPEVEGLFDGIVKCDGPIAHNQWTDFIREGTPVNIPAGESVTVDIECQSLTTAFVNLQCEGGSGSIITLLYAECYEKDLGVETAPFPMARTKSLRSDSSGRLYGVKDVYTVTEGGDQTFEPF